MSQKTEKKLRQLYRREIEEQAQQAIEHWNKIIKPKPRWMPLFVYKWCLKVVLH